MSKKTIAVAAGVLLVAGAVAAVAHSGRDGWRGGDGGYHGQRHGGWSERGEHRGKGGWRHGGREMTESEWDARTRERFARIDANSDGVIDAAEVEAMIGDGMGRRAERGGRRAERMMRRFDADKDGKVTRAELDGFVEKRFAQADLTGDGRISDDDLPPRLRGRGLLSGDEAGDVRGGRHGGGRMLRFLQGSDADKDGAVTLDEAKGQAAKRFAQFDRNKDGSVDEADRSAMRQEMKDYRVKRFLHRYGADADGKVTREMFQQRAKERFAELDHDGDGKVGGRRGGGRERYDHQGRGRGDYRGEGPGRMMDRDGGPLGPDSGRGPGGPERN